LTKEAPYVKILEINRRIFPRPELRPAVLPHSHIKTLKVDYGIRPHAPAGLTCRGFIVFDIRGNSIYLELYIQTDPDYGFVKENY
jgi:hypothetical protein